MMGRLISMMGRLISMTGRLISMTGRLISVKVRLKGRLMRRIARYVEGIVLETCFATYVLPMIMFDSTFILPCTSNHQVCYQCFIVKLRYAFIEMKGYSSP